MSFVLGFKPSGFTAAKYNEVLKQLDAAGEGAPKGRSYHVCYGDPNNVQVTDVWDSMEDFQAFGKTLVPIMPAQAGTGIQSTQYYYWRGSFTSLVCIRLSIEIAGKVLKIAWFK